MLAAEDPNMPSVSTQKRKRTSATSSIEASRAPKRPNIGLSSAQRATNAVSEIHAAILASMSPKYSMGIFSVISSSSISKRVDSVMRHLSRFHPTNMRVQPGVVLLHSNVKNASKLFSIVEIVKRKIHGAQQKWYQYNRLHQIESGPSEDLSNIAQQLNLTGGTEHEDIDEEDELDIIEPVCPPPIPANSQLHVSTTTRPYLFVSVFLSRMVIDDFSSTPDYTMQTNSAEIEGGRMPTYSAKQKQAITDPVNSKQAPTGRRLGS